MTLPKDPNFNHETADVHGLRPDWRLLTTKWRHSGNGKLYQIVGFTWLGRDDEWGFRMVDMGGGPVEVTRPLEHLTGVRENGETRYTQVM